MEVTRKGYYTITGPDDELLTKQDGSLLQVTTRDECYEYITDDAKEYDSEEGTYTIHCPDREVLRTDLSTHQIVPADDVAPRIISTPSVSFTVGTPDTYDMSQHVQDDGRSAITYPLIGTLDASLTYSEQTGLLEYDGSAGTTYALTLNPTDAVGSDTSSPFNITIAVTETQPVWNTNFTNIEIPFNIAVEMDLTDYGVDIDEVHAIASSRNSPLSMLPTGLTLNTGTGVITGTATDAVGTATVITVAGVNGTFDASADWAYRSGQSGVVTTEIFPDDDSVRLVSDALSGRTARSQWDSTTKLYGNGSLRQEIFDTDAYPGQPTNWAVAFLGGTVTSPTVMGVGDEAWVSYTMRFNDVEPRWPFAKSSGVKHGLKLSITSDEGTANSYQVVNQSQWGIYRGYFGASSPIWEDSATTRCGADIIWQPEKPAVGDLDGTDPGLSSGTGAGSAWTGCQHDRHSLGGLYSYSSSVGGEDGFPDPLTNAAIMPVEFWQSHLLHINRISSSEVLIEWYFALLGEDWTLSYSEQITKSDPRFGVLWLTNSHTDQIAETGIRPTSERWYDGLVVRTGSTRIPAPGFTV